MKTQNILNATTKTLAGIDVGGKKGGIVRHPSAALRLAAPLPGPTVPGWR